MCHRSVQTSLSKNRRILHLSVQTSLSKNRRILHILGHNLNRIKSTYFHPSRFHRNWTVYFLSYSNNDTISTITINLFFGRLVFREKGANSDAFPNDQGVLFMVQFYMKLERKKNTKSWWNAFLISSTWRTITQRMKFSTADLEEKLSFLSLFLGIWAKYSRVDQVNFVEGSL